MEYSFWKGLRKSVVGTLVVGLPLVMQLAPSEWLNMTLGGVILLVINFLKVKAQQAGY